MKIEEIHELWTADSEIDKTALDDESLKISKLHNKYYNIYINEKLILRKFEHEFKKLKLDKYEFYTQGPNEESNTKGWKLPAKGMILKADIPMYMEADNDIVNMSLKIGFQQEKIEYLESIIKVIINRNFNIKAAIDFIKFTNGV